MTMEEKKTQSNTHFAPNRQPPEKLIGLCFGFNMNLLNETKLKKTKKNRLSLVGGALKHF